MYSDDDAREQAVAERIAAGLCPLVLRTSTVQVYDDVSGQIVDLTLDERDQDALALLIPAMMHAVHHGLGATRHDPWFDPVGACRGMPAGPLPCLARPPDVGHLAQR